MGLKLILNLRLKFQTRPSFLIERQISNFIFYCFYNVHVNKIFILFWFSNFFGFTYTCHVRILCRVVTPHDVIVDKVSQIKQSNVFQQLNKRSKMSENSSFEAALLVTKLKNL